ncbi:hypothetical protein tpqmel_0355 [Candidatus Gastranaerophilus sp. (ex Termes propinquus)]|nr:hypothetical protein tpqmel_0355 [Candidatus Gastranaerophilus sp. (ex Termes propinquus)]
MSENTLMVANLNEECLLRFLKSQDTSLWSNQASLVNMLKSFGIEIKFQNPNSVYDIIDEYENA